MVGASRDWVFWGDRDWWLLGAICKVFEAANPVLLSHDAMVNNFPDARPDFRAFIAALSGER